MSISIILTYKFTFPPVHIPKYQLSPIIIICMYLIIIHNLCSVFLAMPLHLHQNDLWGSGGTALMYTHLYTYTCSYDHEQYTHTVLPQIMA